MSTFKHDGVTYVGNWKIFAQKDGKDEHGKEYVERELKCKPTSYSEAVKWRKQYEKKYPNYSFRTEQIFEEAFW